MGQIFKGSGNKVSGVHLLLSVLVPSVVVSLSVPSQQEAKVPKVHAWKHVVMAREKEKASAPAILKT